MRSRLRGSLVHWGMLIGVPAGATPQTAEVAKLPAVTFDVSVARPFSLTHDVDGGHLLLFAAASAVMLCAAIAIGAADAKS